MHQGARVSKSADPEYFISHVDVRASQSTGRRFGETDW